MTPFSLVDTLQSPRSTTYHSVSLRTLPSSRITAFGSNVFLPCALRAISRTSADSRGPSSFTSFSSISNWSTSGLSPRMATLMHLLGIDNTKDFSRAFRVAPSLAPYTTETSPKQSPRFSRRLRLSPSPLFTTSSGMTICWPTLLNQTTTRLSETSTTVPTSSSSSLDASATGRSCPIWRASRMLLLLAPGTGSRGRFPGAPDHATESPARSLGDLLDLATLLWRGLV
mmetsp:Transcript_127878/g.347057  ORF Transcript_127878/g.347057 Transcript_127878/m.347057 type:complete len:228 (-) Transcript_127878:105-788(-)